MPEHLKMYLAGEWTDGTGEDTHDLISPVSGEHIATVSLPSPTDVDRAVAAARQAAHDMRHWSAFERADLCLRIAAAIEPLVPEIARIQTLDTAASKCSCTWRRPTNTSSTRPRM